MMQVGPSAIPKKSLPVRPRSPDAKAPHGGYGMDAGRQGPGASSAAGRTRSPLMHVGRHSVPGVTGIPPPRPSTSSSGGYAGMSPSGNSPATGSFGASPSTRHSGSFGTASQPAAPLRRPQPVSPTVEEIKRIDQNREQRRRAADEVRRVRQEEAALLSAQCGGAVPDIDFHRMIQNYREKAQQAQPLSSIEPAASDDIIVCARKRPIQPFEISNRELDCVTVCNPLAIVHERKFKVDGITKCLESHQFEFDRVFDENSSTEDVYHTVAQPLVPWTIERGGRATLFAYGQTGSGKTHTMCGIQRQLAEQIFKCIRPGDLEVSVSFFEIYGGRPYDLLNNRQRLETLEDSRQEVQIAGLTERSVSSSDELLSYIELGNSLRTTHATAINRDSSRSHAICWVLLRGAQGGTHGKVTLVDLAGSERAADSKSSIRQRRVEGAQINKSLLALKECIRAMGDPREAHVPFRASKLTLVLRDAFVTNRPSKTVMIACISPGMMSADHSVNTLRYSDRLKDGPGRPKVGATASKGSEVGRTPSRRRSPSPTTDVSAAGPAGGWRPRPGSPIAEAPEARPAAEGKEAPLALQDGAEDDDDALVSDPDDAEHRHVTTTLTEETVQSGTAICAAGSDNTRGIRQQVPRRGRQPLLRPREAGAPTRPDAVGSRGGSHAQSLGDSTGGGATSSVSAPGASTSSTALGGSVECGTSVSSSVAGGGAPNNARSPRIRGSTGSPLDDAQAAKVQQDNRYLHHTLTTEVYERGHDTSGVVDVGVEDLNDLEHMEALDEVRQWEDRIVSQHMVALQEDARLLTAESELLSQVQQASSYDIDWYVAEVDKVVRRKMEVYASFLEELEVFKAQLRREESLSLSCQKNRASSGGASAASSTAVGASPADGTSGAGVGPARGAAVREQILDASNSGGAAAAANPAQRTPRTPRV
eukprot:TRINITY_DN80_c0_g2_i1.p1 TRINITY_DN80_c0_g2~~TRINITY_DN80_c0_g2_i1.p1  ORF type:complete len:933 (-),score=203.11 TRINITY_DN80_c0_g2_i1:170-2968(-)